jgi:MFS family permease
MVGALADRSGRNSLVLTACALLVAAGTGLLAVANGLWAILLVVVTIAMAQGPLIALADAMTLGRLAEAERSELIYGARPAVGLARLRRRQPRGGWSLEWFSANFVIVLLLISAIFTAVAAAGCMAAVPNRSVVVEGENDEAWPGARFAPGRHDRRCCARAGEPWGILRLRHAALAGGRHVRCGHGRAVGTRRPLRGRPVLPSSATG